MNEPKVNYVALAGESAGSLITIGKIVKDSIYSNPDMARILGEVDFAIAQMRQRIPFPEGLMEYYESQVPFQEGQGSERN